jgi:hypothetical protein
MEILVATLVNRRPLLVNIPKFDPQLDLPFSGVGLMVPLGSHYIKEALGWPQRVESTTPNSVMVSGYQATPYTVLHPEQNVDQMPTLETQSQELRRSTGHRET